jgi:hypothetical protein
MRYDLAKWTITLSLIIAPNALSIRYSSQSDRPLGSKPQAIYDSDPDHLWNRLHRALFVRTTPKGEEYGLGELDPLLWHETKHLLTGYSYQQAIKLLDEFRSLNGAALIADPLKRAMLQRDLWSIFDWSAQYSESYRQERQMLQSKLVPVIRSTALSREQIQALSDNYAVSVRAKVFAEQYDPERPGVAYLPPDLFSPDGPWVCVSARGDRPIAIRHAHGFSGRSAFLIFIRLPEGRSSTLSYLNKLKEFPVFLLGGNPKRWLPNPAFPQFPVGTQLALVRKMILIDNQGNLIPSRLTEQVQIRVHRAISKTIPEGVNFDSNEERTSQGFFEFKLSRLKLLAGDSGGMRAIARGEKDFLLFGSHGIDPFDRLKEGESMEGHRITTLQFCVNCHYRPGIHSMTSLSNLVGTEAELITSGLGSEAIMTIEWKQANSDWGVLQGLWRALPAR